MTKSKISFSSQVKNELCRIKNIDKCCALCEISAVFRLGASFYEQKNGYITAKITTENAAFARKIRTDAARLFHFHPDILVEKRKKLRGRTVYIAELMGSFATSAALGDMGLVETDDDGLAIFSNINEIAGGACCKKAYLRGAFLAAGSVSSPRGSYHLEISTTSEAEANEIKKSMEFFGVGSGISMRKKYYICYVKDAEGISDFLNLTGAHKSLIDFENARILKDVRNNVNRVINFETANLNKTVNASIKQCEDIRTIEKAKGLGSLSSDLREIAKTRIENPEASMSELGKMLNPPIGKSGVSHRFNRINKIAEKIREGNGS